MPLGQSAGIAAQSLSAGILRNANAQYPIVDNFNGVNGTLIQGRQTEQGNLFWNTITGAPSIQSNQAQVTDALLDLFYLPTLISNGRVSAKLVTLINSTGIAIRIQDGSNYIFVRVNAAGVCTFFDLIVGVPTSRGASPATWAAGDTLDIDFRNSTYNMYRNGVFDFTVANSNFLTAKWHGLRGQGAGTAWDVFTINP